MITGRQVIMSAAQQASVPPGAVPPRAVPLAAVPPTAVSPGAVPPGAVPPGAGSLAAGPPGAWLRRQRKAAGLTQEELAERSGVSVRTIADLERGRTRRPYPSSVRALARALGLPDGAGADLVARYRMERDPAPREPGAQHASGTVPSHTVAPSASGGTAAGSSAASGQAIVAGGPSGPVPRQLPTAVPHFAGRARELALLDRQLDELDELGGGAARTGAPGSGGPGAVAPGSRAGTVVISAIGGTAGVGKTALALHWAHRIARRFPDGQLYANLRGFDTSAPPASAADVIRGFLDALQVHPERLPAGTDGLSSLYRSLLADRRMLVVLDNASDAAQVRPLLPASPGCLVIVTSRRELSGLAASEGARLLSLDVLTEDEAEDLLVARLGADRAAREPGAVTELAHLCARLPLALSVTVARAAAQPRTPLAALAQELTQLQGRLDALDTGDATANVRTVFSLSYRYLSESTARMFRLLGLHPGPDITAAAAASLAGVPLAAARVALRDLARASLIIESVPGRYAFHDLLRAYAVEQALAADSDAGRRQAIRRVLDHYLHSAHAAHLVLYPGREVIGLSAGLPGTSPEAFGTKSAALAWLEAEYQVILKVIDRAARDGLDDYAWRLPVVLWTFYYVCGHWHDGAATQRTALDAARRLGDRTGIARATRGFGSALVQLGDYDEARVWLAQAADLFRQLGDNVGLARTVIMIGQVFDFQSLHRDSLRATGEALRLSEETPDDPDMQLVRANALNNSAWSHIHLGEFEQARSRCQQALNLCRQLGYSPGEAGTWDTLGYLWQHLGEYDEAARCFLRAADLSTESGNRFNLATTLEHLAETRRAAGDLAAARDAWRQALAAYDDLHHRDGDKLRARIRDAEALVS